MKRKNNSTVTSLQLQQFFPHHRSRQVFLKVKPSTPIADGEIQPSSPNRLAAGFKVSKLLIFAPRCTFCRQYPAPKVRLACSCFIRADKQNSCKLFEQLGAPGWLQAAGWKRVIKSLSAEAVGHGSEASRTGAVVART